MIAGALWSIRPASGKLIGGGVRLREAKPPVRAETASEVAPPNAPTSEDLFGFVYRGIQVGSTFDVSDQARETRGRPAFSSDHQATINPSIGDGLVWRTLEVMVLDQHSDPDQHSGFRPVQSEYEFEPVFEIEEHSDLLSGMLAAAAQDSRRRAAATRHSIKSRFKGQSLRNELAAARRTAQADLAATRATVRRNFATMGASKRRRRRGGVLKPR
jgi:hypothetical protein